MNQMDLNVEASRLSFAGATRRPVGHHGLVFQSAPLLALNAADTEDAVDNA